MGLYFVFCNDEDDENLMPQGNRAKLFFFFFPEVTKQKNLVAK